MANQSSRNLCAEKRVGLPYTLISTSDPLLMRLRNRLKPENSLISHSVAKVGLGRTLQAILTELKVCQENFLSGVDPCSPERPDFQTGFCQRDCPLPII